MRLQALGDVVEGAGVGDLARHDAAGQVGDLVREGVPHALLLLGQGVRRRRDGVPLDDERVEVDHLEVVVEEVEDGFAGEGGGEGGYGCECCSTHDGRWVSESWSIRRDMKLYMPWKLRRALEDLSEIVKQSDSALLFSSYALLVFRERRRRSVRFVFVKSPSKL